MSAVGVARFIAAWLDEDGTHVWLRHTCAEGVETTMLPYPTWQANEKRDAVVPSFACGRCPCHVMAWLGPKPEDVESGVHLP